MPENDDLRRAPRVAALRVPSALLEGGPLSAALVLASPLGGSRWVALLSEGLRAVHDEGAASLTPALMSEALAVVRVPVELLEVAERAASALGLPSGEVLARALALGAARLLLADRLRGSAAVVLDLEGVRRV